MMNSVAVTKLLPYLAKRPNNDLMVAAGSCDRALHIRSSSFSVICTHSPFTCLNKLLIFLPPYLYHKHDRYHVLAI